MGRALARRAVAVAASPPAVVAVGLAAAFGVAVLLHPGVWGSFTALAGGDKETLREMIAGFGALAPLASILLNVAQAIVAPIPGFVVPYVNGAVFGLWLGTLLTWVGGVAAAIACFSISRTFGRRFAQRICRRSRLVDEANAKIERHGFVAIILLRFLPGMPFDFLSYFVGLTRVRAVTFVSATAIGSAPHAFLYALLGSSLEIPLWMGILMTPALGLVWAGSRLLVTSVRRRVLIEPVPALAVSSWPGLPARSRRSLSPVLATRRRVCAERPGLVAASRWGAEASGARVRS